MYVLSSQISCLLCKNIRVTTADVNGIIPSLQLGTLCMASWKNEVKGPGICRKMYILRTFSLLLDKQLSIIFITQTLPLSLLNSTMRLIFTEMSIISSAPPVSCPCILAKLCSSVSRRVQRLRGSSGFPWQRLNVIKPGSLKVDRKLLYRSEGVFSEEAR